MAIMLALMEITCNIAFAIIKKEKNYLIIHLPSHTSKNQQRHLNVTIHKDVSQRLATPTQRSIFEFYLLYGLLWSFVLLI